MTSLAIISIGHGHLGSFFPGARATKVLSHGRRLLYQMDLGRGCVQNHDRENMALLLKENNHQVQFSQAHRLR